MIQTKRLLLRPWQSKDLAPFAALNADARVMEFFPSTLTREKSDELMARFTQHIGEFGWGFWAVELLSTGEFIGLTGIGHVNFTAPFTPAIEVGWRLACLHWGKGYATEGAKGALHYGFKTLKIPEIVAFTATKNLRSVAVMKKLHMHSDPKDDFDHPKLPEGHPLRRHVLYRLRQDAA